MRRKTDKPLKRLSACGSQDTALKCGVAEIRLAGL